MVHWRQESAPVGLILLEGWCIGIPPQPDEALVQPINETEANKDADRVWRTEVNRQLEGDYADYLLSLTPCCYSKRPVSTRYLTGGGSRSNNFLGSFSEIIPASKDPTMTQSEVADFVLHYQRLTEHGMATLPDERIVFGS